MLSVELTTIVVLTNPVTSLVKHMALFVMLTLALKEPFAEVPTINLNAPVNHHDVEMVLWLAS